jgi:hypothetical protein
MKLTRMLLCASLFAVGIASAAAGYKVNLPEKMWVGTTEIKGGDYKVEVVGNQVTFKNGKEMITVPATVENAPSKYSTTEIEATQSKIHEIHVGGSTAKIVIKADATSTKTAQ